MALNGFRAKVTAFFLGLRKDSTPVIMTENGPVTESARLQAARNMREHPEIRRRIELALAKQLGGLGKGIAEARRRYPEAYEDLSDN